jgi:hypothetical protein
VKKYLANFQEHVEFGEIRGEESTLPAIFDRTMKPYILFWLESSSPPSFLAGSFAPTSVQKKASGGFEFFADDYRGLADEGRFEKQ